jgi:hypothetical protein
MIARRIRNDMGNSYETAEEIRRHRIAKGRAEALANVAAAAEWAAALKLLNATDALRELREAVARLTVELDRP